MFKSSLVVFILLSTQYLNGSSLNALSSVPDWLQCDEEDDKTIVKYFGRDRPRCEAQRIQNEANCWSDHGDWYWNSTQKGPHRHDPISKYKPCNAPHYGEHNPCRWMLDGPGLKYDWRPKTNCSIPENDYRTMDRPDVWELMKGRGAIMIVGDSVSELTNLSWKNHILSRMGIRSCPEHTVPFTSGGSDPDIPPDVLRACNNLTIYKFRDDWLRLNETKETLDFFCSFDFNGLRWIDNIDRLNISILIINRGAHYTPNHELLPEVNATLLYLENRYPDLNIVWRNTPHGHHMPSNRAVC